MKKNNLVILLFFLYFFPSGCQKENENEGCYIAHVPDAYDYPIKPGTPEWALLNTGAEMDSVCQIPEDILVHISTEGLIETVLNYPEFGNIYFLEDFQFAFEHRASVFDGLQEILKRSDAGINLFNRYKLMYPGCKDNNWPSLNGPGTSASFSFAFIEILIAQKEILNQFDEGDCTALLGEVIIKYNEKIKYNYSVFSKKHTILIAGRIMLLKNYAPFIEEYNNNFYVKEFVDRVMLYGNFETLDLIYDYAKKFQNQN